MQAQGLWQLGNRGGGTGPTPVGPTIELLDNDQTPQATTTVTLTALSGSLIDILWGDGESEPVVCDGLPHSLVHDYGSEGTFTIGFRGAYTNITLFEISGTMFDDTVAVFADLTGLESLHLGGCTNIDGSVISISGMTGLKSIKVNETAIYGTVSNFSAMTGLTTLYTYDSSIAGDVSGISGLTNLEDFRVSQPPPPIVFCIGGDVSDLYGNTSLKYLHMEYASLSIGDISGAAVFTEIVELWASHSTMPASYTQGDLPAWGGASLKFASLGLDETEVDDFINDLADGCGDDGVLDISGTNTARSAASDAGKATLLAAGWTVTVNE